MKAEAEANAEADKIAKETVDKIETRPMELIFQTRSNLTEFGGELSR